MNLFSTPVFLETAGALFHPKRRRTVELRQLNDQMVLRLLVLDDKTVVRRMPFYDFPQPLTPGSYPKGPVAPLAYFPRTVVATTGVDVPMAAGRGYQPSPYIDWSLFSSWADFEAFHAHRPQTKANDSGRQVRRLERELGKLEFVYDDPRPDVFDRCVRWKAAQYVATGVGNMFAAPENVELFRELRRQGAVVVNSLSAGSTLLAVHFASYNDGRLGWWVPAYDPAHSKFSPGRLLLERLMRESQARGHLEFDFLIGDEAYKFNFATHNRVIGPVGVPPLTERVAAEFKARAKQTLAKYPKAYEFARELKRRLRPQP